MAVSIELGVNTDTPIVDPTAARSSARHSLRENAAHFETTYGLDAAPATNAATDAVLTMCPSVPCAIMRGTKLRIAWMMP